MSKPTNLETLSMDDLDAVSGGGREDWVGWGSTVGGYAGGTAGTLAGGSLGTTYGGPIGMAAGGYVGGELGKEAGSAAGGWAGGYAYDTWNGNGGADWTDSSFDPMGSYTGY